jgi:hypothetical protein
MYDVKIDAKICGTDLNAISHGAEVDRGARVLSSHIYVNI